MSSNKIFRSNLILEQFEICHLKATEAPFSGKYNNFYEKGLYFCICCNNLLFSSDAKFDSGSGWPSFWEPASKEAINYKIDTSLSLPRIEIICKKCETHLGHVFEDGPQPTYKRYCLNSTSLKFVKNNE